MGIISGYPVGAKITTQFVEQGICTKEEGERMLAFTNNSGPLFIVGTVGITLFGNTSIGILLLVTHILACITVGILLNFLSKKSLATNNSKLYSTNSHYPHTSSHLERNTSTTSKTVSFSSLGEILGKSIQNATSTILLIGGFVVIFSVIISICNQIHFFEFIAVMLEPILSKIGIPFDLITSFLSGIVELTNGLNLVACVPLKTISTNIILSAFLLGFGGISVLLQVFSITSKANLSIKKYIIGKLLQGLLAAFYTYLALQYLPFLQFNLM